MPYQGNGSGVGRARWLKPEALDNKHRLLVQIPLMEMDAMVPTTPKSKNKGRQKGATSFKMDEEKILVDIIYDHLPISHVEWEAVTVKHYAEKGIERLSSSFKTKFKKLRDHPVRMN